MADKPVGEVVAVDAALDALVSPTASDVYEATLPFSNDAVIAATAARALAGGGGGGSIPSLAGVLAEGGDPDGNPVTGQLHFETTSLTDPAILDTPPAGAAAAFMNRAAWNYENATAAVTLALAQYGSGDHVQLSIFDQGNPQQSVAINSDGGFQTNGDANGVVVMTDAGERAFAARKSLGMLTAVHAAPADGDLIAGEMAIWFDQTNGAAKLKIKAKTANGTVVTGQIALT